MDSQERRKNRRIVLQSSLHIKRVDSGHNEEISIEIHDLSTAGIGFYCEEMLQLNAIYDASITIWTKEVIKVLIRIVRAEMQENDCEYGGMFIALSDVDAFRIKVYDELEKAKMLEAEEQS